jgi:hypothetical protein
MTRDDGMTVAYALAALNWVAFSFAMGEYVFGVEAFYPKNVVTKLIYDSTLLDIQNYTALRIPATFANAHSYGGTMAISLPWLLGAWIQPRTAGWQRALLLTGAGVGMIGIFLCAARSPMILLGAVAVYATFSGHLRGGVWLVWGLLILGVAYIVSGEDRMLRFLTMSDTDYIVRRLEGSVNMNFLELLVEYPFGNGLGAGGTCIPHFLQPYLNKHIWVENEYARILLEQGVAGLALWIAFIVWFAGRRPTDTRDPWVFGKNLMWWVSLTNFATGILGTGLMTAIPVSMLFFLGIGFVMSPAASRAKASKMQPRTPAVVR